MLVSNKKEHTVDTCNNLDESQEHYAESKKSHTIQFNFCNVLQMTKLEMKKRMVVDRA